MSSDDVFRKTRNYLTGLDMDRFEAGKSATMRSSRWNDRTEDEKAASEARLLRRGVELASISWTHDERAVWRMVTELDADTAFLSATLGVGYRAVQLLLRKLQRDVRLALGALWSAEGIESISPNVDAVQGTPPQRRPKPRRRRVTRSESLSRIRLPGHERELHWLRGSWIDLLDHTCKSNPRRRTMTKDEAEGKYKLGDSVMRELVED